MLIIWGKCAKSQVPPQLTPTIGKKYIYMSTTIKDPRFQMGQLPKIPNGTNNEVQFQMGEIMKSNSKGGNELVD